MISRALGDQNREKAKQTASFCIWSAAVLSLLYGIAIILLKNRLLPLPGADESTGDFCSSYIFWTVGVVALPTVLNAELSHLIRAEGYSTQAGFGVAFGGILNIILDPIFIFCFIWKFRERRLQLCFQMSRQHFSFCYFFSKSERVVLSRSLCTALRFVSEYLLKC